MSLVFTYSQRVKNRNSLEIPEIKFTCEEKMLEDLPPYLCYCYNFCEYLIKKDEYKNSFQQFIDMPTRIDEDGEIYQANIKHPLSLEIIQRKILRGEYNDTSSFKSDIDLMWENVRTFYEQNNPIFYDATVLQKHVNKLWEQHYNIKDCAEAISAITSLTEGNSMYKNIASELNNEGQFLLFPTTTEAPTLETTFEAVQSNEPLSTREKYDICFHINFVPKELLGKLIDLLKKEHLLDDLGDGEKKILLSDLPPKGCRELLQYFSNDTGPDFVRHRSFKEQSIDSRHLNEIWSRIGKELEALREKEGDRSNNTNDTVSEGNASETSYGSSN